jgi:hypothetical protein
LIQLKDSPYPLRVESGAPESHPVPRQWLTLEKWCEGENQLKRADLFPMENEEVSIKERLAGWKKKFDSRLGTGVTEFAISTAEKCFLAHDYRESSETEPTSFAYPAEAIVNITQVGSRPRARPKTARPAEYAACILRREIGDERDAVHEYLEALLGSRVLDQWEASQRLRRRLKEAKQIARKVTAAYVERLTMDELRKDFHDASSLLEREKDSLLPGMKQQLVWAMSARMILFPLMKSGALDHQEPIVRVSGSRKIGGFKFDTSNCSIAGSTVTFDLKKGLLEDKPNEWAVILSLPAWYPAWTGEVPIEVRLDGAWLQANSLGKIQQAKQSVTRQKGDGKKAPTKDRRKP